MYFDDREAFSECQFREPWTLGRSRPYWDRGPPYWDRGRLAAMSAKRELLKLSEPGTTKRPALGLLHRPAFTGIVLLYSPSYESDLHFVCSDQIFFDPELTSSTTHLMASCAVYD